MGYNNESLDTLTFPLPKLHRQNAKIPEFKSFTDNMRLRVHIERILYFEGDRRPADSQPMATIILQILAQREKLHKDIFTQLR